MEKENKDYCVESGCLGGCCSDISMVVHESVLSSLFATALILEDSFNTDISFNNPGVYASAYSTRSDNVLYELEIVGPCPHFKEGCQCYDSRPPACRHMKRGSPECDEIRCDLGLGIVPLAWIE